MSKIFYLYLPLRKPSGTSVWTFLLAAVTILTMAVLPPTSVHAAGTENAQQTNAVNVSGTVTDENNKPIPGVAVAVKGGSRGTSTNAAGVFYLGGVSKNDVLVFTFMGYTTFEVTVGNRTTFNVTLAEEAQSIDDVVVVGYGQMRKRDISGAIAQLRGEDLLTGNPQNSINQALQGRLAGVVVGQSDGTPGGGINIQVRGVNSFTTNSQPLYVIDGIPFEPPTTPTSAENTDGSVEAMANALSMINPHDIASIEVLKDASATAIYGSRGANGVILITTRQGQKGKPRVEFTSNFSVSTVRKQIEMLNGYDYAMYRNEQQDNGVKYDGSPQFSRYNYSGTWDFQRQGNYISSGRYHPAPEDFLAPGWYEGTDPDGGVWRQWVEDTNWQDQIFRTAFAQEYNFSVTGGTDHGTYAFSGNYNSQDGIIKNTGYNRYTLRANITQEIFKHVKAGININYTNSKTDFAKGNSLDYSILRSALIYPSTIYEGDFTQDDELLWLSPNPRTYVLHAKNQLFSQSINASAFISIDIMNGLNFRQNLGLNNFNNERSTYYNRETGEGRAPTVNGRGGFANNDRSHTVSESILTFRRVFNDIHNLNIMGAFTMEQTTTSAKTMSGTNFPTDITENYNMGAALVPGPLVSSRLRTRMASYLGRANYVLKDKYIFTASVRHDGTSNFQPGKKFQTFYSGAVAWRASEEEFIKRLNIFDNLKVRASFGQTGNQGIAPGSTEYELKLSYYMMNSSELGGFKSNRAFNPDLKWETTDQFNAGIDFGILKNRVNVSVDYYHKKTRNLLINMQVAQSTGFQAKLMNYGHVTNEGLEIQATYRALMNTRFKWTIDGNISFNRNRIGGMDEDSFAQRLWHLADEAFIQRNGMPIGAIYGNVEDGFYDNEAEVRADPAYATASDAIVKKMIGEIKLRSDERYIIGNTNPDYTFGITNNFAWKNLSFSFFVQGVIGNDIFNGNLMSFTMMNYPNVPKSIYNTRWTENNKSNAKWPKATNMSGRSWQLSDRYVEDGSYIRLKNVNLGYTLVKPKFWSQISSIYLYVSATNLVTITNYSWYDPDVNAFGSDPARRGVDIYSYPTSRTFSLGLKIQF